jgi:hypothetical protein
MKYTKYPELKNELKKLAKEIRQWKNNRKMDKRAELGMSQWQVQGEVDWRKDNFRHKHIAYCILRGRGYEQIENYCRVAPDFDRIDKIMETYDPKAICASA